jgi:SAM-dependent methyltransferase
MLLQAPQITRLDQFLERVKAETYPELPGALHDDITRRMLDHLWTICTLKPHAQVLDVGCGQGVALKHFVAKGLDAVGVTLNPTDADVCRRLGYRVLEMDQSFLDFPDATFDLVWCRHCLEHSIFPFFTLTGFHRVLKPGGWLYVEVPAPDTSCGHQNNPNHYSVLGKSMLASLLTRAGFRIRDQADINFTVQTGPDTYWAFIQERY